MPIKIVRVIGGPLDGKELRSDDLTADDEHFGNMDLLAIPRDAPPGKTYSARGCVYEIAENSVAGDIRTIVLRPARKTE